MKQLPLLVMLTACLSACAHHSLEPSNGSETAPRQLSREAFEEIAPRLVAVEPQRDPSWRRFATATTNAGYPGLCQATVVGVDWATDNDLPITSSIAYKVVGDLKPLPDTWNDRYEANLERKCAHGQVFSVEDTDVGYFQVKGSRDDAWYSIRAVQLTVERAAKREISVRCGSLSGRMAGNLTGSHPDDVARRDACEKPAEAVGQLSLSRIYDLSAERCPGERNMLCLEVRFAVTLPSTYPDIWLLRLKAGPRLSYSEDVSAVSDVDFLPRWTDHQ